MPKIIIRKSHNRLKGYDYSRPNHYYVTTCTQDRVEFFGEIRDGEMMLNAQGRICLETLRELPEYHKNIIIDEHVVMPNHVHAVIVINDTKGNGQALGLSLQNKSLPKIMRDFKSFSSREINKSLGNNGKFRWQRSFYDHIIRTDKVLNAIREYIRNNPAEWHEDEENMKGDR